ncbi:hypothetical protein DID73_02180 [Candidatus Marinamargulisbacteria bacterium SCGC AG-343-K17]|nr:hypothetical protein DID73_02180 [Candidatus Marinamargulisbacteria bacterium SCGC AG-343-K17]
MMKKILLLIVLSLFLVSCRGWRSEKPPIHPNINFDFQPKVKAQTAPLEVPLYTMQFEYSNKKSRLSQFKVDEAFLKNGQKNYNIYCAACHTKTGDGTKSIISQNGWIVSNLLEKVTASKSDNELYNIIQNGIRTMPGYRKKLDSKETWEVVLYVRALQRMTSTTSYDRRLLKRKAKK